MARVLAILAAVLTVVLTRAPAAEAAYQPPRVGLENRVWGSEPDSGANATPIARQACECIEAFRLLRAATASGSVFFLQRDPAGYADSVNLYAGFANDAVNMKDPMGRQVAYSPPESTVSESTALLGGGGFLTACAIVFAPFTEGLSLIFLAPGLGSAGVGATMKIHEAVEGPLPASEQGVATQALAMSFSPSAAAAGAILTGTPEGAAWCASLPSSLDPSLQLSLMPAPLASVRIPAGQGNLVRVRNGQAVRFPEPRERALANVRSKVEEMKANMTQYELDFSTYAAAQVCSPSGQREIWVAGAGQSGRVPRRIRGNAIVRSDPLDPSLGVRINDAEQQLMRCASREGYTVEALGATRDICHVCQTFVPVEVSATPRK